MTDDFPHPADPLITEFVTRTYGLRGALALHRHALGWDLLRAPVNVMLAPVVFLQRVLSGILSLLRLRGLARRIAAPQLMYDTALAREVDRRLRADLLEPLGVLGHGAPMRQYGEVRAATGEIAATLGTLGAGAAVKSVTPGVMSLAPAVAAVVAQTSAVAAFPLGGALGAAWYGVFPAQVGAGMIALTALGLALSVALMTTFSGIITDPIQARLGIHQRRLRHLVTVLEAETTAPGSRRFSAPEHTVARLGDISDAAVNALRFWRG